MKKLVYSILGVFLLASCVDYSAEKYDFAALKDSLGLDSADVFVEEVSPLYTDSNPNNLDSSKRVKALFYNIVYNEYTEKIDTIIFVVLRDNDIVFWGRGEGSSYAKDLIEKTIKNRKNI